LGVSSSLLAAAGNVRCTSARAPAVQVIQQSCNNNNNNNIIKNNNIINSNNNNNNDDDDNVYGAVIVAQSHCESSPGSFDEYGTAPSGRQPSDQVK